MTGRGFVARAVRLNTLLSIPALGIVFGCAAGLLDLTPAMWRGIGIGIGIYLVVAGPANYYLNGRIMAPIVDWLDAVERSPEISQRAYHSVMRFPLKMALSAALSWVTPATVIAVGMRVSFEAWTWLDACVLIIGGVASGFAVGMLTGFGVKSGEFAQVREAIAAEAGGPDERARLALFVPMRTKLVTTVTGAGLVPVLFAVLIAYELGGSPVMLSSLVVGSVVFSVAVSYFLARDISRPAAALCEAAERLGAGDLRPVQVFESEDEMGQLSRGFDGMAAQLRSTIAGLAESADRLESQASSLTPVCGTLSAATAEQEAGTRRAAESMDQINTQVSGIAHSSQALNESVEESSSSILELGASGEELNETATLLSSKVDEVSSSIEEMVASVKQVSVNTESLSNAAEETSASMEEMASSLREVEVSVEEASRLSRSAVDRAEIGREKVRETIVGMDEIRDATETAESVIRDLHGRTVEIGAIVDVIDDVADETNLLALNAAIIAAQSGEQGRAFSVVADEIKDLAERVLVSTKEIGGLIRNVQEESRKATDAIERGSRLVASGVDLSAEAGMALEEITSASQESGDRIGGIVSALREQAKGAGHVVDLMERVRGGVQEIRRAAAEQDRGNVVVYEGSVTMREVALQVRGTTEEQSRGSVRIRESAEGVRHAVEQINSALQEQSQACAAAVRCLEQVRGQGETHEEATRQVEGVAAELLTQAEAVRAEVRRFRIE
jgi:methyl-accepting chemotaxis protein